MKRTGTVLVAAVMVFALAGVAFAKAVGTPEIDRANAVIDLRPVGTVTTTGCAGEDAISYVQHTGSWKGVETEVTPGFTDYGLSGPLTLKGVVWTINGQTGRGVLTGTATLTGATTSSKVYSGPLTLITQGDPAGGNGARARGWLDAATFTGGTKDGGSIFGNVDATISNSYSIHAQFGDAPAQLGVLPYSVATNNLTC